MAYYSSVWFTIFCIGSAVTAVPFFFSGGYMMAAVADEIYCSPFAVIGSIGVVSTMPNFSQRLTREGIEVEDITAGKYKRTMTPYKPSSPTDRAKVKKDIEQVLEIFKKAVVRCRPKLKDIIEEVATGEVWHGPDALERKLVDGLRIGDDILIDYLNQGADVWAISVKPAKPNSLAAALGEEPNEGGVMTGLLRQFASYLVKEIFVPAVVQNLSHQHLPEFDGEAHETYSLDSGLKAGAITGKTALAVDWSPTKR